uniref:Uncharacterized protein n=1 Tax=Rhizophora mucronata TaxID=61149 RepID=A0A2P2IQ91_RHIMU
MGGKLKSIFFFSKTKMYESNRWKLEMDFKKFALHRHFEFVFSIRKAVISENFSGKHEPDKN